MITSRARLVALLTLTLLLALLPTLSAAAAAPAARITRVAGGVRIPPSLVALPPDRLVSVYVVLEGEPAARSLSRARGREVAAARVQAARERQAALKPRLRAVGAVEIYSYQRVANAIQIRLPAGQLRKVAALPGVVRLDPVGRYRLLNSQSVPATGAPVLWSAGLHVHGEGIRIGVIDTGIDYTHADFGGPGTAAAYDQNDRTKIEENSFPTARVIGGWDFTGDEYNAFSDDPSVNTPRPDPDPADCNGHGTHVAGTAAGQGVLSDGTPYTGPYDDSLDFNGFRIGPGMAPAAQLYALKIFGCNGSSEVLLAALEWAADPDGDGDFADHLDVVNLSLGCDFSCGVPTELEAIDRLSKLGAVVVAAAGNAADTFYIAGDPASATSAIAVAAGGAPGESPVAAFSSRGPGGPDARLKPEITAPGSRIVSAGVGSGNQGTSLSGTSMATPHVAGAAALLKQIQPEWSVEEIKAALMNTAADIASPQGGRYPESRVGAGNMRVDLAAATQVTAAAERHPGSVALSFGALALAGPYSDTQTVRLTNHGDTDVSYTISVSETVTETGVILTPLVETVTVPAGGEAGIAFRLDADPARFDRTGDSTTAAEQMGHPRHLLYEASGQIHFDGPVAPIHLPYYANVRAASELRADVGAVTAVPGDAGAMTVTIPFAGSAAIAQPLVTVFEVGVKSADQRLHDPLQASADLIAVGVASDAASRPSFDETTIYFGIATAGEWATPHWPLTEFAVYIDTDRDGSDDFRLYNGDRGSAPLPEWLSPTDTFVSVLTGPAGDGPAVQGPVNIFPPDIRESAPFNTDVLALPVSAVALGMTESTATFNYRVVAYSVGVEVDRTGVLSFNAAQPSLDTATGPSGLPAHDGASPMIVRVTSGANPRLREVLLLYHTNVDGTRAEIVSLPLPDRSEFFLPYISR